ncbi:hypothetical protein ACQKJC_02525 [Priestia koreensis]|uniref:hypothetical protein n=1 Tax=Priestia koreensis TaxID=284581 RepID=UPI003D05CD31
MKKILQRALESDASVEIIYMDGNGTITQRTVIIHDIHPTYIKALCLMRNQTRIFSISNILAASMTKAKRKLA